MDREPKRETRYFFGGKGGLPTWDGEAAQWWVPHQFTSKPRLLMAARLATGVATLKELEAVCGGYQSVTWHIVASWVAQGTAEWMLDHGGGVSGRHRWREVSLTPEGRRNLWRFCLVPRRLLLGEGEPPPPLEDVPGDPVDAVRRFVQTEFLRPSALALLHLLMRRPRLNMGGLGRYAQNFGATRSRLRAFRAAGFVTDVSKTMPLKWSNYLPEWKLSEAGRVALERHVDALCRVSAASGYEPERACEVYYPDQAESPCARLNRICGDPPCPDCMFW